MLYITGDIHGNFEDYRLELFQDLTEDDTVIVLGDFGFDWDQEKIENYPNHFRTLFLAGNHENFDVLNSLPKKVMFGAEVGVLKENVYHLLTGNIYTIAGKKFLIFGGAASIDKNMRTPYVSWWPDEIPPYSAYEKAKSSLANENFKIDYLLTHTAGKETVSNFFHYTNDFYDPTEVMITAVEKLIKSDYYHYFGHHHKCVTDGKHTCLYEEIIQLC